MGKKERRRRSETKEEKEANPGASQGRSKARSERAIKKEKEKQPRGKTRGRQKQPRRSRGSRMRRQCSRQPNHGPSPLVGMLPDWPVDTSSLLPLSSSSPPSNPPMEVFHDCHPPSEWWGVDMIPACDSTARPRPQ
ncbi:hypothetical protein BO78DRAFT_84179 [Aspergillus sclerotiicarbonarius CBS 121057]|uniref:Uncharacterized protein n=1 Tax=Aspergillus sclerotiicarbonarius (strain CBS 121057 / IBT 28362) TaxID=1448318 RepID=A0A319FJD3_ASPSB|nr:hypothetical protein BO78DRAFT_84179 [Aspergillus sclerotiicarbonarius CBS 121057]